MIDRKASRRGRLAGWLVATVAVAGVASGFDALVVEPVLRLTVTEIELPSSHEGRLSRRLGGARVVHLTDLHIRGFGWRERRLARVLKQLEPDLLLLTGDYGEGPDGMNAITRVLESVKPPLGAYGVPGNNDHYRGEFAAIEAALDAAGVTLLVNRSVTVRAKGGTFAIAGVDDPHYGRDDVAAAVDGVPEDMPLVLLAHSPDLLQRKARGLLVNAGDERGAWHRGSFWQDGSHVRPDPGEVVFPTTGKRRLRVVRREDGVGVAEIRLLPVVGPPRRMGRKLMAEPPRVPGEIAIEAGAIRDEDIHGEGWRKRIIEGRMTLLNAPDRGFVQSWVDVSPESSFESEFEAVGGIRYHVWVHLVSMNEQGSSDSVFVQFTDSLNAEGRPDYRIGMAMPEVDTERVDLMLAGHAHGGQVRLPFIGSMERNVRMSPYQMGMYQVGSMPLFVSRGVGWSSLPVRFWCPPEVVVMHSEGEGRHAGSL